MGGEGAKEFHCWCTHGGKMLLWKYHPSWVITAGWSKTPSLSKLVIKFPLTSVRAGIWLFNLQENMMGIFKAANNTLYQPFSCFLAPLLYLALTLVYRKDSCHYSCVLFTFLWLCFPSFLFLYAIFTLYCSAGLLNSEVFQKNMPVRLKYVFLQPNCTGHSIYCVKSLITV